MLKKQYNGDTSSYTSSVKTEVGMYWIRIEYEESLDNLWKMYGKYIYHSLY